MSRKLSRALTATLLAVVMLLSVFQIPVFAGQPVTGPINSTNSWEQGTYLLPEVYDDDVVTIEYDLTMNSGLEGAEGGITFGSSTQNMLSYQSSQIIMIIGRYYSDQYTPTGTRGEIWGRNGGGYQHTSPLLYELDRLYRVKMEVTTSTDTPATFSIWFTDSVTGETVQIANNFVQRSNTGNPLIVNMDNVRRMAITSDTPGFLTVENVAVNGEAVVLSGNDTEPVFSENNWISGSYVFPAPRTAPTQVQFDLTVTEAGNNLIALSSYQQSVADAAAVQIALKFNGTFSATNGAVYAAENVVPCVVGDIYRVEATITPSETGSTYSLWVTDKDGVKTLIANNYTQAIAATAPMKNFGQITLYSAAAAAFNIMNLKVDSSLISLTPKGNVHLEPTTLTVGPGKDYETPAAALVNAIPGDVIEIYPGTYFGATACAVITVSDLTFIGMPDENGKYPTMDVTGYSLPNRKGAWTISGGASGIRIENLNFTGAIDNYYDDYNWAGIRIDNANDLWLVGCTFFANDNGILVGGKPAGADGLWDLHVDICTFYDNGGRRKPGQEHNMYIGTIDEFYLTNSISTRSRYGGHLVKSRAENNYIINNILMECENKGVSGSNSVLDICEGGNLYVIGNILQKGTPEPAEGNRRMLLWGSEAGLTEARSQAGSNNIWIVNNTFIFQRTAISDTISFIPPFLGDLDSFTTPNVNMYNNVFTSTHTGHTNTANIVAIKGVDKTAEFFGPANVYGNVFDRSQELYRSWENYSYRLAAGASSLIGKAVAVPSIATSASVPAFQTLGVPTGMPVFRSFNIEVIPRATANDVGAYEHYDYPASEDELIDESIVWPIDPGCFPSAEWTSEVTASWYKFNTEYNMAYNDQTIVDVDFDLVLNVPGPSAFPAGQLPYIISPNNIVGYNDRPLNKSTTQAGYRIQIQPDGSIAWWDGTALTSPGEYALTVGKLYHFETSYNMNDQTYSLAITDVDSGVKTVIFTNADRRSGYEYVEEIEGMNFASPGKNAYSIYNVTHSSRPDPTVDPNLFRSKPDMGKAIIPFGQNMTGQFDVVFQMVYNQECIGDATQARMGTYVYPAGNYNNQTAFAYSARFAGSALQPYSGDGTVQTQNAGMEVGKTYGVKWSFDLPNGTYSVYVVGEDGIVKTCAENVPKANNKEPFDALPESYATGMVFWSNVMDAYSIYLDSFQVGTNLTIPVPEGGVDLPDYGTNSVLLDDDGTDGDGAFHAIVLKDTIVPDEDGGIISTSFRITHNAPAGDWTRLDFQIYNSGKTWDQIHDFSETGSNMLYNHFGAPVSVRFLNNSAGFDRGGAHPELGAYAYDTPYDVTVNINTGSQKMQIIITDLDGNIVGQTNGFVDFRSASDYDKPVTDIAAIGFVLFAGSAVIGNLPEAADEPIDKPEPTLASIVIASMPTKVVYTEGEALDLTGLVVNAIYSDASVVENVAYETLPAEGTILSLPGTQTIAISFRDGIHEVGALFSVTILDDDVVYVDYGNDPVWIEDSAETEGDGGFHGFLLKNPILPDENGIISTTFRYTPDASYNNWTRFDLLVYNSGKTWEDLDPATSNMLYNHVGSPISVRFMTSTGSGTEDVGFDRGGSHTFMGHFGYGLSYDVTVSIDTVAQKAEVVVKDLSGEIIAATQGFVDFRGADDYDKPVMDIAALGFSLFSGKVALGNLPEAAQRPTVEPEVVLESIEIASAPAKLVYTEGNALNLAGLVVNAIYNDGSSAAVVDYVTDPADGDILSTVGVQTILVGYEEDGITVTNQFDVTVNAAPVMDFGSAPVTIIDSTETEGDGGFHGFLLKNPILPDENGIISTTFRYTPTASYNGWTRFDLLVYNSGKTWEDLDPEASNMLYNHLGAPISVRFMTNLGGGTEDIGFDRGGSHTFMGNFSYGVSYNVTVSIDTEEQKAEVVVKDLDGNVIATTPGFVDFRDVDDYDKPVMDIAALGFSLFSGEVVLGNLPEAAERPVVEPDNDYGTDPIILLDDREAMPEKDGDFYIRQLATPIAPVNGFITVNFRITPEFDNTIGPFQLDVNLFSTGYEVTPELLYNHENIPMHFDLMHGNIGWDLAVFEYGKNYDISIVVDVAAAQYKIIVKDLAGNALGESAFQNFADSSFPITDIAAIGFSQFHGQSVIGNLPGPAAAPALSGITLDTLPSKVIYNVGESLNLAGLVVLAQYSDGSSAAVAGYVTSPANGAVLGTLGVQNILISYTEGGIEKTAQFSATVGNNHILRMTTDARIVRKGTWFNVAIDFENTVSTNIVVLDVAYDASKFDFGGYTLPDGTSVLSAMFTDDGVQFVLMIPDYAAKDLITIHLGAKTDVIFGGKTSPMSVDAEFVVIDDAGEKTIVTTSDNLSIPTEDGVLGDVNGDGVVDLIDLSDIIDAFGITSEHQKWQSLYIVMDFNDNGYIDISDIAFVASLVVIL